MQTLLKEAFANCYTAHDGLCSLKASEKKMQKDCEEIDGSSSEILGEGEI